MVSESTSYRKMMAAGRISRMCGVTYPNDLLPDSLRPKMWSVPVLETLRALVLTWISHLREAAPDKDLRSPEFKALLAQMLGDGLRATVEVRDPEGHLRVRDIKALQAKGPPL